MNETLSDLVLALEERLQFFWNFYFGTCLAVLAFVATVTDKVQNIHGNCWMKGAITLLFSMFAIGNVEGIVKFARRLKEASAALRTHLAKDEGESVPAIVSRLDFRFTVVAAIIGHTIGDFIVIASIWLYLNPKS
ncbi:MAG TPA: hypothetical protein VL486_08580 [Verrucomicrobiae bacterium]|nr:hypothetical protein [Verrucomicrobiae bacterium]